GPRCTPTARRGGGAPAAPPPTPPSFVGCSWFWSWLILGGAVLPAACRPGRLLVLVTITSRGRRLLLPKNRLAAPSSCSPQQAAGARPPARARNSSMRAVFQDLVRRTV